MISGKDDCDAHTSPNPYEVLNQHNALLQMVRSSLLGSHFVSSLLSIRVLIAVCISTMKFPALYGRFKERLIVYRR